MINVRSLTGCPRAGLGTDPTVVLAFDELPSAQSARPTAALRCPDCWSDLRDEPVAGETAARQVRHRCTRCGAGWETNDAGWKFPVHAA